MQVKIQLITEDAIMPQYAHDTDAGMDIFAAESLIIKPNHRALVSTGICMAIPEGYVGLVWDKSGLAVKNGVKTMAGVIDSGYRGEIKICLINLSSKDHPIQKGTKIAQMLIQKVEHPELVEVYKMDNTERGEGGFGSTGLK